VEVSLDSPSKDLWAAGYNFSASVTFTSNPPGLVNYTTTVSSATQTVSVPTNGSMPEGTYTLKATPTAGGTSKTKNAVAVSSGL
jgi:hypothetical protein